MSARLAGKAIVITGVGDELGLGFAIARRALGEGARLVVTDKGEGVHACAALLARDGQDVIALQQDVTQEEGWREVIGQTVERFGRIDGLVNNAGIADLARIADISLEGFRRSLDINLTGPFLGMAAAVEAMRRHGRGGSLVNISSVAGIVGFDAAAAYAASKGGLRTMTKALAIELAAEGIRCNSVHPGSIETGMLKYAGQFDPVRHAAIIDAVPMKKLGLPADIAACVCYLLSDEANYVTGAEFVIDGGLTAQ